MSKKGVGLFRGRWKYCTMRAERCAQLSQLSLHWAEVSCGGMEGNEGGLKQAGWPGPLLADGGKRHLGLLLWMLSSAAIVWRVQRQTHALRVSLATRNRNRPPHPWALHTYTPHHRVFPQPLCMSGLHKSSRQHTIGEFPYSRSPGQTERNILLHSWPQMSTESERSDNGDTQGVAFHRYENIM